MSQCVSVHANDDITAGILQSELHEALFPTEPLDYYLHLTLLTVLLVACLIIVVANVEFRRRRGLLWPAKWTTTVSGSLINPSPVVLWSLGSFLFLTASIPYIWLTRGRGAGGWNIENPIAFRLLVWWPLWVGAWSVAWATVIAPLTLLTRPKPRKFDIAAHPWIINSFFLSVPFLLLLLLIPFTIITSLRSAYLFDLWKQVDAQLTAMVARDPLSHMKDVVSDPLLGPLFCDYKWAAKSLEQSWKASWGIWAIFIFIEIAVFFSGAVYYYIIMNRSIEDIRRHGSSAQLQSLSRAYRSLMLSTWSTLILEGLYFAMACWLATSHTGHRNNHLSMTFTLGAVYVYATLGTLTNLVILIRTFQFMSSVPHSPDLPDPSNASTTAPSRFRSKIIAYLHTPTSSIGQISVMQERETTYDAYGEGEDEGKERELC